MTNNLNDTPANDAHLERAVSTIRQEYARRHANLKSSPGASSLESRLQTYGKILRRFHLIPLAPRRILDVGCGNGRWLNWCCERWGALPEHCIGTELRESGVVRWREEFPDSKITLQIGSCHQLQFDDAAFDVVHQSMLFSSLIDAELRQQSAVQLWRVLKPGGHMLWYDFFINPINRMIVPMTMRRIRPLFPQAQLLHRTRIAFAPPIARLLTRFADPIIPYLEALKIFNTHYLLLMRKPV